MMTDKIENLDRKAKEGTDKLYETADNARKEVKNYADEALLKGEEGLNQVKDSVQKFWNRAKKTSGQVEDQIVDYTKDNLGAFQKFAEKRPIQVAAVALAVGVLLGGILFASTRD